MKTTLEREWQAFWLCLGFISRIPIPVRIDYSQQLMNQSSVYFPVAGLVLGAIYALAYSVLGAFLPQLVSLVGVLILHLWITGAFHEDGLADSMDALGGGFTVEKRLAIMKDSRIGTYGTVAVFGALALKLALLAEVELVWAVLLVAPALARVVPLFLMALMPYVTDSDASRTKPVADTFPEARLGAATLFAVLVAGLAGCWVAELMAAFVIATGLVGVLWGWQLRRRLGGYTGDALGASVVFSELALLTLVVAL
mgnify:FL=1